MIFNIFKKKDNLKEENEILLKRIEYLAVERAMLKQIISDCLQENEGLGCEFTLSDEFVSRYGWWARKSDMKGVWVVVDKFIQEQKKK